MVVGFRLPSSTGRKQNCSFLTDANVVLKWTPIGLQQGCKDLKKIIQHINGCLKGAVHSNHKQIFSYLYWSLIMQTCFVLIAQVLRYLLLPSNHNKDNQTFSLELRSTDVYFDPKAQKASVKYVRQFPHWGLYHFTDEKQMIIFSTITWLSFVLPLI